MTDFISPLCMNGTLVEVTLVGADGTRHPLISTCRPYGMVTTSATTGLATSRANIRGVNSWRVSSRELGPDIHGETVTGVKALPSTFRVPIVIAAPTETGHEEAIADLGAILNPQTGPCRLVYKRADGTEREISCTYIDGARNLEIENLAMHRFTIANPVFRAHWPFWRQVDAAQGTNNGEFENGLFAHENIFDVVNVGDVETWPEITITGPAENVELANQTTGDILRIVAKIGAGETARIVADPARRAVFYNETARFDILDPIRAQAWRLLPGSNRLLFRAIYPDGTAAGRSWSMRWPIWWQTP